LAVEQITIDPSEVIHETVDGEVILIGLQTGCYYSLEGSGAEIWEGLAAGRTSEDVIAELERRYSADPDEISQAVSELVERLVEERLVRPGETNGGAPPRPRRFEGTGDRPSFERPVLHKFTDMQDLLLVDPVHDVGDAGWPHRPPAG
jgi:Coenzyme PQQ synthesis protein D (PqqD)